MGALFHPMLPIWSAAQPKTAVKLKPAKKKPPRFIRVEYLSATQKVCVTIINSFGNLEKNFKNRQQ